jgi:phosphate transport system protein
MSRKFDEQLSHLKSQVLRMGDLAQSMVLQALRALVERDEKWTREVIRREEEVDRYQVEIDDEAVRLMAIQSPVAQDLRFILMVARITTELERVGDLCVNICENVQLLLSEPPLKPLIDLPKMAEIAERMLHESIAAFMESTAAADAATDRALAVCRMDGEVDALKDQIFRELLTYMISDTRSITRSLSLILLSRNLERIADHATNIAEEVIYLAKGEDIRHRRAPTEREA